MFGIRRLMSALPLVVLSSALSLGADTPAMRVLKEKGLARSGRFFVIGAEESALEKWRRTRAVVADYAAAAERLNGAELAARELAQLEERRAELQGRLNELNQQINEQGFLQGTNRPGGFGQGAYLSQLIWQRDMIRANLAETVSTQRLVKANAGTDKKTLEEEARKRWEAAESALKESRESVDAATKRYDELNSDATVRSALRALERDKMGTFKLGPSTTFKAAVKALESAERTVLAKRTATVSRKKSRSRR